MTSKDHLGNSVEAIGLKIPYVSYHSTVFSRNYFCCFYSSVFVGRSYYSSSVETDCYWLVPQSRTRWLRYLGAHKSGLFFITRICTKYMWTVEKLVVFVWLWDHACSKPLANKHKISPGREKYGNLPHIQIKLKLKIFEVILRLQDES